MNEERKQESKINCLVANIYDSIKRGNEKKVLNLRNKLRNEFQILNIIKKETK